MDTASEPRDAPGLPPAQREQPDAPGAGEAPSERPASSSSSGCARSGSGSGLAISQARLRELLPGLSPGAAAAVAARHLDASRLSLGRHLGCGAFATVYRAQLAGSRGKWVVKRLDRAGPGHVQQVSTEVEVLTRAGCHPNLVPFKGWYADADGVLCLVLGCCEGGSLASLLKSRAGGAQEGLFPEAMVMCWFVQLLLALHHLHSRRILHRDLKPDNCLLSANLRVLRLADFGISKQLDESAGLAMTCLGTPQYLSPEQVCHRPYTFASDMWSLGVLLYEMLARRPAFDARGLPQLVVKIMRTAYAPLLAAGVSRPVQQLVAMLLRADPDDRPSTADLLGTQVVRRHLQLLLDLAQAVPRAPATPGAKQQQHQQQQQQQQQQQLLQQPATDEVPCEGDAAAAEPAATAGGGAGGGTCSGDGGCSGWGGSSGMPGQQPGSPEAAPVPDVDLGGGVSLALQDMQRAVRLIAAAPLPSSTGHSSGSSSSSSTQRRRVASHTAGGQEGAGSGAPSSGSSNSSSSLPRPGSSERPRTASPGDGAAQPRARLSLGPAASAPSPLAEAPPASAAERAAAAEQRAAAAAALAALPLPLAAPGTRQQAVKAWESAGAWDAEQRRQAEARRQASLLEQRLAREAARARRKELDPAAAVRAAAQQAEGRALQAARAAAQLEAAAQARALRQQGSLGSGCAAAAVAAAAAAQDAQLQLMLDQLGGRRAAGAAAGEAGAEAAEAGEPGSSGALSAEPSGSSSGSSAEQSEAEDGAASWPRGINEQQRAAGGGHADVAAPDAAGSSCTSPRGERPQPRAQAQQQGRRVPGGGSSVWRLAVRSLEDGAFAALLPACRLAAAPPDSEPAEPPPQQLAESQQQQGEPGMDCCEGCETAAGEAGLPALLPSEHSPATSPRDGSSGRGTSSKAQRRGQQQRQQAELVAPEGAAKDADDASVDDASAADAEASLVQLEQQLEGAWAHADAAAAESALQQLWRASIGAAKGSKLARFGRARAQSAADAARDERAAAALTHVLGCMVAGAEAGCGGRPSGGSSSSGARARSALEHACPAGLDVPAARGRRASAASAAAGAGAGHQGPGRRLAAIGGLSVGAQAAAGSGPSSNSSSQRGGRASSAGVPGALMVSGRALAPEAVATPRADDALQALRGASLGSRRAGGAGSSGMQLARPKTSGAAPGRRGVEAADRGKPARPASALARHG